MRRRWHALWLVTITSLLLGLALATPLAADTRGATLHVVYSPLTQQVRLTTASTSGGAANVIGNGFGPGEVVSIYVTFPDGRVFPVVNLNGTASPPPCCPQ